MKAMLLFPITCALLGSAALAATTPFSGDSAATWSARSLLMAKVLEDSQEFGSGAVKGSLRVACDGLTGEQMSHEYGKEPRWALRAQIAICSAYDGWAGKFRGSPAPCRDLEHGLQALDGAAEPGTPPEVSSAAASLRVTVNALLTAAQAQRHACKL